jgi:drug/metabolite transporter (DMT)-like permease
MAADGHGRPALKASLLMATASLLFALMGVAVKFASSHYGAGEIVMYRSLVGLSLMALALRWRGINWRTPVPLMHFWRSASGTTALCLWFTAIAGLPLATAMTLSYMSSVWIALFLIGGAALLGPQRVARAATSTGNSAGRSADVNSAIDGRLVAAVLAGFAGVAMVLRPTFDQQQAWAGLLGLLSGVLAATAYLQVTALGRVGEPTERVVFYFSLSGLIAGGGLAALTGGLHGHSGSGLLLLLAIGLLATVAQWMMTRAYATGATLGVAALQYLGIAFSFVFGVWLFQDPVTPMSLVGMVLIVGAGVAATLLRGRPRQDTAAPNES